jgi:hypothetical protein
MITLFLMMVASAHADNWLCTSQASERRAGSVLACGIGRSGDEARARSMAFDNAKREFAKICNLSNDCRNHKINVVPNRTECQPSNTGIVCHRLISFEIGGPGVNKLVDPEPFSVEDVSGYPRLKRGMSIKQMFALWGKAASSEIMDDIGFRIYSYRGPMCEEGMYNCEVEFYRGKLKSLKYVKIEYDGIAAAE